MNVLHGFMTSRKKEHWCIGLGASPQCRCPTSQRRLKALADRCLIDSNSKAEGRVPYYDRCAFPI